MPLYLSQFSYTPEALEAMIETPEYRVAKVREHLEQVGGKLISFYYSFGDYHAFTIYEVPTGVDALSTLLAAQSKGYLTHCKTTEIFSPEEGLAAFRQAGTETIDVPKKNSY